MDDLRRRLQRLGVTTGRDFKPRPRQQPAGGDIDELVDGESVACEDGVCFRVTRVYETGTLHGSHRLADWLQQDPVVLARLAGDEWLADTGPGSFVFLDTETTGLGGGAFAFLVGVGFFDGAGQFVTQQFFLRDPADEPALLALLHDILQPGAALVTFNGRTFDVPLLASRCVLARRRTLIDALGNLDLLHPARRLWRRRLQSCALSSLEADVLGVRRTGDVPGSLIPYLYQQYLQTRDAREMVRVLYHNEMDVLSMVSLGLALARAFEQPGGDGLPLDDRLSLANWYVSRGMHREAEQAFRGAAEAAPDAETRHEALHGLGMLLKRAGRREEAVPCWQDMADLRLDTPGYVELAKHYEWHARDLQLAIEWTDAAIALAESWRPGWRRTEALRELYHRRERLARKLSNKAGTGSPAEED
ncbi:MAG TPA: ribonuclease H-like domain-containing protein [Aggregatilineales bacterium]|nr:ribonuclease H-like domain-containing protein [Aggregatilineales bacterium]